MSTSEREVLQDTAKKETAEEVRKLEESQLQKKKYESKRQVARQANILSVARDMLAEVGYEKTTIRALAERAKVAPGTLYNLYNSKDELIVAAVREVLMQVGEAAEAESEPGVGRLLAMAEQVGITIKQSPGYAEAITKAMLGPGEHERLNAALYLRFVPLLEREVQSAVDAGQLEPHTPVTVIAKHLQSQSWGMVVAWMMGMVTTEQLVQESVRSQALTLRNYATAVWAEKLDAYKK